VGGTAGTGIYIGDDLEPNHYETQVKENNFCMDNFK
jgi:hypothetical protein